MFAVLHRCNLLVLHPPCDDDDDDDDSLTIMKAVDSAHHFLLPCVYGETNKQKHEHVLPHFLLFLSECSLFWHTPSTGFSFHSFLVHSQSCPRRPTLSEDPPPAWRHPPELTMLWKIDQLDENKGNKTNHCTYISCFTSLCKWLLVLVLC